MAADMNPRHTILVVDDEPEILDGIRRTLRDEGYKILTSTSPMEAMQLLDGGVDLLLTDIDMPEMNGLDLIARVRKAFPEVVRVVITGQTTFESAMAAINEGEVHRYLTKPWNKAELRETIRQALDRLEELRRVAAADHRAAMRERLLGDLEREHPGIRRAPKEDGVYVLDAGHLLPLAASVSEELRALLDERPSPDDAQKKPTLTGSSHDRA